MHMIAWDKVCLPTAKGGLGIPSLSAMQFAFNCSVITRIYNFSSPLAIWLFRKYSSPWKPPHVSASKIWKSICNTALQAKSCFNFKIVPNAPISLQWDHWFNKCTLLDHFGDVDLASLSDLTIKDIMLNNSWVLPDNFSSQLCAVFAGIREIGCDGPYLLWKDRTSFCFKNFIVEFYSDYPTCNWYSMVWHKRHVIKHLVYVWLALKGALKTTDALSIRNIHIPTICSLCNQHDETISHLFFECSYSFSILNAMLPGMNSFLLKPNILQLFDWLNRKFNSNKELKCFYLLNISTVIYYLWKERNSRRRTSRSSLICPCATWSLGYLMYGHAWTMMKLPLFIPRMVYEQPGISPSIPCYFMSPGNWARELVLLLYAVGFLPAGAGAGAVICSGH
ncbi:uncharacterized protein LOC110100086 [Dendrobium catenatum]|uniref:uncharacterized protein LOC110100086 n=1 Tax=Dendrobium catenatum TaxID=906689 RepID=UPI0009F58853|nr:uncharacterized protein LOC110100086 [Dendrobium catenatum]